MIFTVCGCATSFRKLLEFDSSNETSFPSWEYVNALNANGNLNREKAEISETDIT